jgi:7-cyano-7-deazaguanine synthase
MWLPTRQWVYTALGQEGKTEISAKGSFRRFETIVLLSGGIDSTSCLSYYVRRGFRAQALFVNYGQISSKRELKAARLVCHHFRVPLRIIELKGVVRHGPGLIRGRNAFLLLTALIESEVNKGVLALGIHGGTKYQDCSPRFVREMQAVFDTCTDGCIQIGAPFLRWRKGDIWTFAKREGVPLHLTYSCERGLVQPCGLCDSCKDLEKLNAGSHQQD